MALVKDTNSYATVVEADTYFADRLGADAWTSATSTKKAQALITATATLDQMSWSGVAKSSSLAFPREGYFNDPSLGIPVDMSVVPNRIIKATIEPALHLLSNEDVLSAQQTFDSITVDTISLDFQTAPSKTPTSVMTLVRPMLINGGASLWWRAN